MDALPDKTLGRVASPTRVQGYIASNTNTKRRKTSPSASGFIQVNNEPGRVGIAEGSSDQSFSQEKVAQIDSGYGTSQNTPDTQRSINHDSIPGTSPSPLLGGNGLKVFNKKINPETTARFREIVPELERLLAAHLRDNTARLLWSKPSRVRPKAIRLLTLGITDTDTAEYIVLFCHESEVNRVQGFFNEPIAKGLYEPEDRTVPSFKVLVSGHAFRLRSGETDILVMLGANENEWPTLCGQPVLFEKVGSLADRRKASRAIIGGMIKVIDHTDFTYLYAMTAGHAILGLMDQENETTNTQPQPSGSGQASQKDDSILLDPFGSHLGPVVEDSTVRDEILTSEVQGIVVKTFCTLPILYPSSHDWALVHVTDPKPNKYLPQGINGPPIKRDIVSCYEGFPDTPEQAILMNKSKGDIHGSISEIPARIALGSADDFIDVYVFTPDSSVGELLCPLIQSCLTLLTSSTRSRGRLFRFLGHR